MTHDGLRALLPAYAAGELDGPQVDLLRAHLAGGCEDCLQDVFRRPVGLPRAEEARAPAVVLRPGVPAVVAAMAVAAVVIALLAVRAVADLRRRAVAMQDDAERVAMQSADERAGLEARVRRLERELEGARAEASAQAEAARATRADNVRLQEALRTSETPRAEPASPPRRVAPRPAVVVRADRGLRARDPAATPPIPLVRLRAIPPFRDPRGHVLWDPDGGQLRLYAFDLPPLPFGAGYRVRFRFDDGTVQSGPDLQPGSDGAVSRVVPFAGDARRLQEIEIVLEPTARPVLGGRMDDGAPPSGGE